jgi:outer membrane lipoprotein-sorting protein
MRHLRTASTTRLLIVLAATVALVLSAGFAQAALNGADKPEPKALDRAIHDAVTAPPVDGVTARVTFTNGLLPSGSLPDGAASPLAAGAEGRLWLAGDGRMRLELQAEAGDAQIVAGEDRLTVYDSASETVYAMPIEQQQKQDEHQEPTLADVRSGLDRLAGAWNLSGAQPTTTAGRPAYTVRIAPKDDGGLLGAAELAWDALNGVPLRAAVYAQGQDEPVLELEADDVSYGEIDASTFEADHPATARVVEIDPVVEDHRGGGPSRVRGVEAVQDRLGFQLSAPRELAGLDRRSVRLVDMGGESAALSIYGEGMGAIAVLQHEAGAEPKPSGGEGFALPRINIDGATGTELATPLGTLVTFRRGGIEYVVVGSVPPVAAENAARGL